jgi:L-galactono-1,4-lactone dehydrogenase
MERLLAGIEANCIPAHSPIEQRWSASSSSFMSPAHGPPEGLHSWVGIINYLPTDDERQRRQITKQFIDGYCTMMKRVGAEVNATSHWAKLERPSSMLDLIGLQILLESRFPLAKFNELRAKFDPRNILASPMINIVLGKPAGPDDDTNAGRST